MATKHHWACDYHKTELETRVTEGYGHTSDELKNLIKGCTNKIGDIIEINDWEVKGKITSKGTTVHLVVEEDGSVRWYLNPDEHSDLVIRAVNVKKIGKR